MKVTIIGKYGPYPKPVCGATSCYLVEGERARLVMDFGCGALSRLLGKTRAEDIDAIILTHLHFDHTSDLLPFRYLAEGMKKKPRIYAPADLGKWYDVLFEHPYFEVINYDENSVFNINGINVSFFKTKHTVPSFGIRLFERKTLVYTGDTVFYDGLYEDLRGADTIIADCSKPIGFNGPHMTVKNAMDIRRETGAKLICSHANVDYSPIEDLRKTDIISAEEMTEYEV